MIDNRPTRVLLTVEKQLHSHLLKHVLASSSELEVVGEATDVVECMRLIALTQPDVWIHSWDEGSDLQAVLSHIYNCHPRLSVIRVSPNEPAGYIQIQVNSLPDLLTLATRSRLLLEAA